MKTRMTIILALVVTAAGCSGDEESAAGATTEESAATGAAPAEPEGPVFRANVMGMDMTQPLVAKAISVEGYTGLTIQAPENATVEESRGQVKVISAGVNYSLSIRRGAFDAADSKRVWGIIDPDGSVLEEAEDVVLYQRSGDAGCVLFSVGVTVGEEQFTCGSVVTAFAFTRNQVDQMITSCRTLAAS